MYSNKVSIVCSKCNGTGWQKRKEKFVCLNCKDDNKICYICENANRTQWTDCSKCYGDGKIVKKSRQ
jgi:DnaJ-class molecular chaperone